MSINRLLFWISVLFFLCVNAEFNIEDLEWSQKSKDGAPRGFYPVKGLEGFLRPFIEKGFSEGRGVAKQPKKLGQGTYGATYKINWPGYKGGAIAKVNKKERIARHEASILAYLDGAAGTPRLIAYESRTGSMVMEHMGSSDIRKLMNIGLSRKHMLMAFMALTHRLDELHNNGIVHGDLKPNNVMVSFDAAHSVLPEIHLIDFGLASLSGIRGGLVPRRKNWKKRLAAHPWYSKEFFSGRILDNRADFPGLAYVMRKLMPDMEAECPRLFELTGRAMAQDRDARPYLEDFFLVLLLEYLNQERKVDSDQMVEAVNPAPKGRRKVL